MTYVEVVSLRRGSIRENSLTYHSIEQTSVGSVVRVPFGKSSALAIVIAHTNKPAFETKPITSVIYPSAIPVQLTQALQNLSKHYAASLSSVFGLALPRGIEKSRRGHRQQEPRVSRPLKKITLSQQQNEAIEGIQAHPRQTHLLEGVTGSGKTQVYIELTRRTIEQGRSAIVLVPEISLTTQIVGDFENYFENVVVTHSNMTESQRHEIWESIAASTKPVVVIGPRSALFTPLHNIGLIVVDECHEDSFAQDTAPRYDGRRVGRMLATHHKALFVMGSATPNVVDRYLAEDRGKIHRLTQRVGGASAPNIEIIDATHREDFSQSPILSNQLIDALKKTYTANKQSLIFHNRRGTATIALCTNCGWNALCPDCEVPLTLHSDEHTLKCHICGINQSPPNSCPDCGNADILYKGYGTKRVAEEVKRFVPGAKIARFDADNSKAESLANRYQAVHDHDYDIIVGTQIVAKGLDLPSLTTIGITAAESSLHLPDYAASERTFQLLSQVSGRGGRRKEAATVIMQSHQPGADILRLVREDDYEGFYTRELAHRKLLSYPPFVYLLQLTCSYASRSAAQVAAAKKAEELASISGISVLGPAPAFYEKRGKRYRWTLVIKSKRRDVLLGIARENNNRYWGATLDPASLL